MEKTRLITPLLAITVIFSSFSAFAETPSYAGMVKEKAMHQLKESINRFKQCLRGQCTNDEILKATRDLGIVATIVITSLYGLGNILGRTAVTINEKTKEPSVNTLTATDLMRRTARTMQVPALIVTKPLAKAERMIFPFKKGDQVHSKHKNKTGVVQKYNRATKKVTVEFHGFYGPKILDVPADEIELSIVQPFKSWY